MLAPILHGADVFVVVKLARPIHAVLDGKGLGYVLVRNSLVGQAISADRLFVTDYSSRFQWVAMVLISGMNRPACDGRRERIAADAHPGRTLD